MACDDATTATDALLAALAGPRKASVDSASVEQHSLADLIAVRKFLAAECAARSPLRGLRFTRLIPPGTVS